MNLKLLIILYFPLSVLFGYAQETGFPIIRNYTPKEYNNLSQFSSILQDKRGVLYFGGADILEYDGVSWRSIPLSNHSNVYDIKADRFGKIYVAAIDELGYLGVDKKGFSVYHSLKPLLKDSTAKLGTVWYIKLTSKYVYFYTYDAIYQYSPEQEKFTVFPSNNNGLFWADFVYNDTYYVRLEKKGLQKIENNQMIPAVQSEFFKNKNTFWTALPYDDSTVLISTLTEGLILYQPLNNEVPATLKLSHPEFLKDNNLYSSAKFGIDYFFLGSAKSGAVLFNKQGNILQHYNQHNLLQDNTVYYIKSDSTQNIWLAMENGISKAEPGLDLCFWDKNCGLNGVITSVIRFNGKIYISSSTKIYYIDDKNQVREVKNIPPGQNWCFLDWGNGQKLLAGTMYGVFEIKEDTAIPIENKGLPAYKVSQSVTNPNRIFSTSYFNLISARFENGKWIDEGVWSGINDDIRHISEDEDGVIWLGTRLNGIIKLTPVSNATNLKVHTTSFGMNYTIKYYQIKDSLTSSQLVIVPNRYKNQTIWGTMYGFYAYNSKTDRFELYRQLNEKLKTGRDRPFWLQEMPDGKIWVLRYENDQTTLGYMDPDGRGKYNWITAPFRRIPEMKMSSCYVEPSGIAWIFGNEGLYRYDLTKDKKNYKQPFNCLVRKVTIATDSTVFGGNEISKTLKIDYKFNSLKFEFAAPFFDGEEKTLYSYQLVGYDTAWSVYNRKTEKEYTNLSEGTYKFRVKARNIYNVESETGIYSLTILPPWYRTWLSYVIYLIAFVAFIVLILKLYTRRLLAQKESLEQIVKERTAKIETQKEELRAKNEKLVEMDHFKEGMTGMIVHDLKNPLNTILSLTKKPELQHAGKQMLNMVLNILDVQKFENAQVKIQPIDFDFHSCLKDVLLQTKFLFERKSIQILNKVGPECVVNGDYELIQRVCINLLSNAIKYTPNNGIITISCEQDPANSNNVKLSVIDTGTGVPPDKLHLIFDKFVQIEAKDSGSVRSTGLGLTFCKLAVEAHGCLIGVNSEINEGSTFWFTLPKGSLNNVQSESVKSEIEVLFNEDYKFTEEEKQFLIPYTTKLTNFTVYEFSDIIQIIETIQTGNNQHIISWKRKLLNAVKACNEELYNKLIKID